MIFAQLIPILVKELRYRKIVKVAELSTGHLIGQDCALYVERPDILEMVLDGTAQGRITNKMNNFFNVIGLI
jgi:hypothetical protein